MHGHGHHADDGAWDAPAYDALVDTLEPALARLSEAMLDATRARAGTRLLDLACGPGHTTQAAARRGCDALGLDLDAGMIAVARRRFPELRFEQGDMLRPPAGPWDAIVCRMGGHHVDPAWIQAAHHVLRPGGALAITELDGGDGRDEQGMQDADIWEQRFREAGFEGVESRPIDTAFSDLVAGLPEETRRHVPMTDGAAFLVVGRAKS